MAAAIGAATYGASRIFGTGALGPVLVSLCILMAVAAALNRRLRHGSAISTAGA